MSFPILCLINKTVVDLSLTDLLSSGEISFKEWTSHRCLINGDDLAYRDPFPGAPIRSGIERHGSLVGLVVNKEKTMESLEELEINSTLFRNGQLVKKINLAAWKMGPEVTDVIGFARESTISLSGFKKIIKRNLNALRRSPMKVQGRLPSPFWRVMLRDPLIRSALVLHPVLSEDLRQNAFPVVLKPEDYALTRGEECDEICAEVARLRKEHYRIPAAVKRQVLATETRPLSTLFRSNKPMPEERILFILRRAWERKRWDRIADPERKNEAGTPPILNLDTVIFDGERQLSHIDRIVGYLRENKEKIVRRNAYTVEDMACQFGIADRPSFIHL
jgi:hypothetical protein